MVTDGDTLKVKVVCTSCDKIVEIDIPVRMPKEIVKLARCPNCGELENLELFRE